MSNEVWEYFLSLDIKIAEIYGLSESTGPHLMNDDLKPATVGRGGPGMENKIRPFGETSTGD